MTCYNSLDYNNIYPQIRNPDIAMGTLLSLQNSVFLIFQKLLSQLFTFFAAVSVISSL
jgi:hypothetical protein